MTHSGMIDCILIANTRENLPPELCRTVSEWGFLLIRLSERAIGLGNMSAGGPIELDPGTSAVDPARRKLGKSTVKLCKPVEKAAKKKGAEAENPKSEIDD